MANLQGVDSYDDVYQLEVGDEVKGGEGGISNRQAQALLNRTVYLKNLLDAETSRINDIIGVITNYPQVGIDLYAECTVTATGVLNVVRAGAGVNTSSFSASRNGTGRYTVFHPLASTDYFVIPQVQASGSTYQTIKIGGVQTIALSFSVWTGDDASANDAAFKFTMFKFTI